MDSDSWLDEDLYVDWNPIVEDQSFPNSDDFFQLPTDGQVDQFTVEYLFEAQAMNSFVAVSEENTLVDTSINITPAAETTSVNSEPAGDFAHAYVPPIDNIHPRIEEVTEEVTSDSPKSRDSSVREDGVVDTNSSLNKTPTRRLDPEHTAEHALEGTATQSIATSDSPVDFDDNIFSDFVNHDLFDRSDLPSFGFGDNFFDQSINDDTTSLSTLGSGIDGRHPSEEASLMSSTLSNPRALLNDNDHSLFTDISLNTPLFDVEYSSLLSVGSDSVTRGTPPAADVAVVGSSVVTSPRTTVDKPCTQPTTISGVGYSPHGPDWFPLDVGDGGETVAIDPFAQNEIRSPEPLDFKSLDTLLPLPNQFNPTIDLNTAGKGKRVLEMSGAELQDLVVGKHVSASTPDRGNNLVDLPIRMTPPAGRALLNTPPPRYTQVKSATLRNSPFLRDDSTGLPTSRSTIPSPLKHATTGYAPAITSEPSRRHTPNVAQTRTRMSGLESPHFVSTELPAHPYTSAESVNLKQKRKRILDVNESPAASKSRIIQAPPSSTGPSRDAHLFTTPPCPIPQHTLRRPTPPILLRDRVPHSTNVISARYRTHQIGTPAPLTATSTLADTYSWFLRPDPSTSASTSTSRPAPLPAIAPAPAPANPSRRRPSNSNSNTAIPPTEQPLHNRWLAFMTPEGVAERTTTTTQAQWNVLMRRASVNDGLITTKDGVLRRMVNAGNGVIAFVPVKAGDLG